MPHIQPVLTLEAALEQILAELPALPAESVPLDQALGRFAAEPITAPIDLPSFDNSAMDGYAVRSGDLAPASAQAPVGLSLSAQVAAGELPARPVQPGQCARVFTGSPIPPGADAVVMQEYTRRDAETIAIFKAPAPGEHVRPRGEDIPRGAEVLPAGARIEPGMICLLAALGLDQLRVRRQPIVGVLPTGSELVEPGQPLPPGKIYDSNRASLAVLLERAGAVPQLLPAVPDTLPATRLALENALGEVGRDRRARRLQSCDALLTSGGVSVGDLDFVKPAFEQLGGRLDLWQVAIKPGKPFVFGRWGAKLLFGLPGNPVSAWVTFLLLVRPALLRMQGAQHLGLPSLPGVLSGSLKNPGDRRHFMRVRMDHQGRVEPAGLQASHAMSGLARANGLVDVPPGAVWQPGQPVQVLRWDVI